MDGENGDSERPQLTGATGLAVRLSFVAGLVGLVIGVGLGRGGSGDAFIVDAPSPLPRAGSDIPSAADEATISPADTSSPSLTVTSRTTRLNPYQPVVVRGRLDEPARVEIGGRKATLRGLRFQLKLAAPPVGSVAVTAVDRNGNRTAHALRFSVARIPLRGIHVPATSWTDPAYRRSVMSGIRRGVITTVQLDLKDESGIVSFGTRVPLARKIGASRRIYDLDKAVRRLHRAGARVVGRVAAFRDPILATASIRRGLLDRVIQTRGGGVYTDFTNFANPVVRRYNMRIAAEAAGRGVDDILYDYVRRPEAPLASLRIPGLKGSAEDSITSFVKKTRGLVHKEGALLGVSVFGIAASRPAEISQSIPDLAAVADYVSPMLYPSHWGRGEYGVTNPNAQPYQIVRRSIVDFIQQTKGTEARVIPWLQDFSLGINYTASHVRAQIAAAADSGIEEWLLWNPSGRYTVEALRPLANRRSNPT